MTEKKKVYARKCSVTGEGMNEGFVYRDGEMYFKYEKDLIAHLRSLGDEAYNDASDQYILDEAYNLGEYCFTEFEDDE